MGHMEQASGFAGSGLGLGSRYENPSAAGL